MKKSSHIYENEWYRYVRVRNIIKGKVYEATSGIKVLVISVASRTCYGKVVELPPSNPTYFGYGDYVTFNKSDLRERIAQTEKQRLAYIVRRDAEWKKAREKSEKELKEQNEHLLQEQAAARLLRPKTFFEKLCEYFSGGGKGE